MVHIIEGDEIEHFQICDNEVRLSHIFINDDIKSKIKKENDDGKIASLPPGKKKSKVSPLISEVKMATNSLKCFFFSKKMSLKINK